MKRFCLAFVLLLLVAAPVHAARKSIADLSEDFVAVTHSFSGAHLTVFGVLRSPADVVIVIEGPPAEARVRTKSRQLGLWINGDPEVVSPVPGYYAVLSSRPLREIITDGTAQSFDIGLQALPFAQTPAGQGVIENRKAVGLYREEEGAVRILESKLFRAAVKLPASVPIGLYKVHVYEFAGGKLVASRSDEMRVAQIGSGAWISQGARRDPLLYGMLSLALSLLVGGGAAFLLRKKG